MSDLIHRIESVLKEKDITFYRVERECGFGNGTIKRWSEQSPRLDKLVAVAKYLGVSLDYLVFGTLESETTQKGESIDLFALKQSQGLTCDGSPLDDDEADLIAMYRLIDPRDQRTILDLTKLKYQQLTKDPLAPFAEGSPWPEQERRIPYAAHGWADVTPEADALIQEKLRQFEKRARELKGQ